ncbi:MAG TPA: WbqC family protein, partial [Bacteroidia bacterium]|nr:WbqC family protein [Bacteroidia bacterium]
YFQLINAVDVFVVYDDVNYINKGWINRNYLLGTNTKQVFTVPLNKASQNKLINEIDLFEFEKFKKNFLKAIELSYKKSPYYNSVKPLLTSILSFEGLNLSSFIKNSIEILATYLNISTTIVPSSTKYQNKDLKAQDRIIDICLKEKATSYINPIGGVDLYSAEKFSAHKISLNFIKTEEIKYKQTNVDFVPYLSILDVLMFNSQEEIQELLKKYTLVKN